MDQQHHHHQGYESYNDFGFVNAFATGSENFTMNQATHDNEINTKTLNELGLPGLINQTAYDSSRAIENSALFGLTQQPTTVVPPPPSAQYAELPYQIPQSLNNVESKIPSPVTNQSISPSSLIEIDKLATDCAEKSFKATEQQENQSPPEPSTSQSSDLTIINDLTGQNSKLKTLGVVRKDVPGGSSSKKRRRIVLLNDDEDSDDASDLKKEVLNRSSELDESVKKDNDVESEGSEADNESEHEETENFNDLGALKAKFLLKNAVIIQDPDKKKKKKPRLLDSDDEEQLQTTSVDDIGLIGNENENEEESFENDIIIAEPVIQIENPILVPDDCANEKPPENVEKEEEKLEENEKTEEETKIPSPQPSSETIKTENKSKIECEAIEKPIVTENVDTKPTKTEGAVTEDTEIDPSMSVEAILENIKPMADDDEFFKFDQKSDDDDVEKITKLSNEEYFGSPDKSVQLGMSTGKKRGPKPGSKRTPQDPSLRKKRGDRYEDDFVDDSDSGSGSTDSDYTDSSSSSSESSVEEVRPVGRPPGRPPGPSSSSGRGRPPLIKKHVPAYIPIKSFSSSSSMKRKIKKDRFYDRSRDIPNEVYFGDVKVPLHVLHTKWGSDDDSDYDDCNYPRHNSGASCSYPYVNAIYPSSSSNSSSLQMRPQYTYIHDHNEEPKLTTLREFVHLCGIKVNYQKLFDGIKSTDHKCMLLRRIMAQKGLQGDPTVAKCKKIRRELQAKRESMELDKSVIINAEGRTRRSVRKSTKVGSYVEDHEENWRPTPKPVPAVQPETLQTLSKIRGVIDSDSE